VRWRGIPAFVRGRAPEEVQEARATALALLPDRLADTASGIDGNRTKQGHEEWLVVTGLCTHLGCVLSGSPTGTPGEVLFCPCHAARFDVSGRPRRSSAQQSTRAALRVPTLGYTEGRVALFDFSSMLTTVRARREHNRSTGSIDRGRMKS